MQNDYESEIRIMNTNKKTQLVWDPKITRKLLKLNDEFRFCPFCGAPIEENCECHKNFIVDYKPYKNSDGTVEPNRSVAVFHNNKKFQEDNSKLIEEIKAKKEAEEPTHISVDLD